MFLTVYLLLLIHIDSLITFLINNFCNYKYCSSYSPRDADVTIIKILVLLINYITLLYYIVLTNSLIPLLLAHVKFVNLMNGHFVILFLLLFLESMVFTK